MAEFTQYGEELLERRQQAIAVAKGSSVADVEAAAANEEED
jgi:hypothetical protein